MDLNNIKDINNVTLTMTFVQRISLLEYFVMGAFVFHKHILFICGKYDTCDKSFWYHNFSFYTLKSHITVSSCLWLQILQIAFVHLHMITVCRENFAHVLFFFLFTLWPEGEFKTGLIELYTKHYIRKQKSGQIQNWANQSQISIGQK